MHRYAGTTQADYRRMCGVIIDAFADFAVADILPSHIYEFCKQWVVQPRDAPGAWKPKPRTARMYRALLSMIFVFGASTDWPNSNPAAASKTFKPARKRDRYITDDELDAIKQGALWQRDGLPNPSGEMIVCFIDLAYATAQRVGDLLALQWKDVTPEGIFFSPAKTVNSTGVKSAASNEGETGREALSIR